MVVLTVVHRMPCLECRAQNVVPRVRGMGLWWAHGGVTGCGGVRDRQSVIARAA
jgi:hypothetical protein